MLLAVGYKDKVFVLIKDWLGLSKPILSVMDASLHCMHMSSIYCGIADARSRK